MVISKGLVQGDRAPVGGFRLIEPAQILQGHGLIGFSPVKLRIQLQGLGEGLQRLLVALQFVQRITEVVPGGDVAGIELQAGPVALHRFVMAAEIPQFHATVGVGHGVPRSQPQAAVVGLHRLRGLAAVMQHVGQDEPSLGIGGTLRQRPPQQGLSLLQLAQLPLGRG